MIYVIIKYFMIKFKYSILGKEQNGRSCAHRILRIQFLPALTAERFIYFKWHSFLRALVSKTFPHLKHWLFLFFHFIFTEGYYYTIVSDVQSSNVVFVSRAPLWYAHSRLTCPLGHVSTGHCSPLGHVSTGSRAYWVRSWCCIQSPQSLVSLLSLQ